MKDVNAAHEKSNEITIGIPFPVYDHQRSSTRSLRKGKKAGLGMKLLEAEKIDKNLGLRARS